MNRRDFLASLGMAAGAVAITPLLPAYAAPTTPLDKWALVVGIKGDSSQPIAGDGNARLMASALKTVYGFSSSRVLLLTNREGDHAGILAGLAWLRANTTASSSVYVFYSGHGSPNGAGLAYSEWTSELATIAHARMGVVIEACYSGNGPAIIGPVLTDAVVIGSTLPGDVGVTRSQRSPFADDFIDEAMRQGLGDVIPNGNGDGRVSLQEAFSWLNKRTFDGTIYDSFPNLVP